jgi:hypothetical protein
VPRVDGPTVQWVLVNRSGVRAGSGEAGEPWLGPGAGSTLVRARRAATTSATRSSFALLRILHLGNFPRAACHADQWPETRAQRDSAETYTTESSQPIFSERGIIRIQKTASQPLTFA